MTKALLLFPFIFLAACAPSEGEMAEKEYAAVSGADDLSQSLNPMDKCRAANRVKDAYAHDGDKEKYEQWSLTAYNDCSEANRR